MKYEEYLRNKNIIDNKDEEQLKSIIGKQVWICDFRLNSKKDLKPIRSLEPTFVQIIDNKELPANKTVYYANTHFREIKNGKLLKKVIAPYDNTGFRSYPGIAVNIFETRNECVDFYNHQLKIAEQEYELEINRIKNKINEIHNKRVEIK